MQEQKTRIQPVELGRPALDPIADDRQPLTLRGRARFEATGDDRRPYAITGNGTAYKGTELKHAGEFSIDTDRDGAVSLLVDLFTALSDQDWIAFMNGDTRRLAVVKGMRESLPGILDAYRSQFDAVCAMMDDRY